MSSPFAITATSNSTSLDPRRHGEAAFTVFNASGRPIRGRARLTPENAEAGGWLSLAGAAERDLPIAGTEQYTVHIAVPRDAPPGSYAFRLDMVGVENPDELFTQGPTVTFEVSGAAPQKAFPWWIVLAGVGGLLLCGMLAVGGYLVAKNWPTEEPTLTPEATATATRTPTPVPTGVPTPVPTQEPTPEPVGIDIVADADAFYWPDNLACIIGSCPDWGHGPDLQLVNMATGGDFPLLGVGKIAIHFDLGAIPAGATIEQATLYLYLTDAGDTGYMTINAYRATSPWSEDNVTVQPTCELADGATRNVSGASGWYDWNVTASVQQHQASPTMNYGICLRAEGTGSQTFGSREGPVTAQPYLRVIYRP